MTTIIIITIVLLSLHEVNIRYSLDTIAVILNILCLTQETKNPYSNSTRQTFSTLALRVLKV